MVSCAAANSACNAAMISSAFMVLLYQDGDHPA